MTTTKAIDIAAALEDDKVVKALINYSGDELEVQVVRVNASEVTVEWEYEGSTFMSWVRYGDVIDAWVAE